MRLFLILLKFILLLLLYILANYLGYCLLYQTCLFTIIFPTHKPTYPYTEFLAMDDMMSLLYGHLVSWGLEPRINSCEFTKFNSFLQITCHNFYPISHVHTVPIERCAFLYALITDGSMCFPSNGYSNHC